MPNQLIPPSEFKMLSVSNLESLLEAFGREPWFSSIQVNANVSDSEHLKIAWYARLFNPEIRIVCEKSTQPS